MTGPDNGAVIRDSLGPTLKGSEASKEYVGMVRAAFPDGHNRIDVMTWSGTHEGKLRDVEPTGRRVEYAGAGIFRLSGGGIASGRVVGYTQELWGALGRLQGQGKMP